MTSSPNFAARCSVLCSICARHVDLESSKTDERGKAVHENCYVRSAIGAFRMGKEEEVLELSSAGRAKTSKYYFASALMSRAFSRARSSNLPAMITESIFSVLWMSASGSAVSKTRSARLPG